MRLYPKKSESVELASPLLELSASSFSVSYCQTYSWSAISTSNFYFLSFSNSSSVLNLDMGLHVKLLVQCDHLEPGLLEHFLGGDSSLRVADKHWLHELLEGVCFTFDVFISEVKNVLLCHHDISDRPLLQLLDAS